MKDASAVRISGVPAAAATTNGAGAMRSALVIGGLGFAALVFLLVLTVPATAARYTAAGRVVMDRQTDMVLVGLASLLLVALLFLVTK